MADVNFRVKDRHGGLLGEFQSYYEALALWTEIYEAEPKRTALRIARQRQRDKGVVIQDVKASQ